MDKFIVQALNLTKEFTSGGKILRVLDDVSLDVKKGESLAILGKSGSGKSTLLSLMAGMDGPTKGEVLFDGVNISRMPESELSKIWGRRIGFIFQSYHLLPALSAQENVAVPLELAGIEGSKNKSREWLEKVGLGDRLDHVPAKLSGGEQQRVALARALAPEPDLLFADEPTGNLDSRTGQEMGDLLFDLVSSHGTTLIRVTHEDSFARRAGRVLHLNQGRL